MKQLIVNADDLGADKARNQGIFEAIEAGRVTSVSVLVNGDGFEDAMERWKSLGRKDVSIGIHINLSEGKPICKDLHILAGQDGFFLGKQAARNLLTQQVNGDLESEIRREVEAQIGALDAFKAPVTHLDGHQHIHVAPGVLPIALKAASDNKIPWIRIPDEPHPSMASQVAQPNVQDEATVFSSLGIAARSFVMLSEVESCDHFRGLYLKGKLDMTTLDQLLRDLPVGLTEWMVHPGRVASAMNAGPFATFSTIDREKELTTLLDPGFPILLEKYGIILTPFPARLP